MLWHLDHWFLVLQLSFPSSKKYYYLKMVTREEQTGYPSQNCTVYPPWRIYLSIFVENYKFWFQARKITVVSNKDQINRSKLIEQEGIVNNCLSTDKFTIDSAIFDPKRVCWHLDVSSNFWKNNEPFSLPDDEVSIKLPGDWILYNFLKSDLHKFVVLMLYAI